MSQYSTSLILLAGTLLGCGGSEDTGSRARPAADSMPGMIMLALSATQVQHGGIAWRPVTLGPPAAATNLPGQVVPNEDRTARLDAPAGGRVVSILVRPGDRVVPGQVLATLHSPEAGMAQADLAKAKAELISRQAQASYARTARGRAERLLALKVLPRQEYERAVADDEQARAALAQAEAEAERAMVTAGQLGASDTRSGELVLRAPRPGVVLTRSGVPGTVVNAGAPLVVVTDPASLWLTVNVPETLAGSLRLGDRVRFTVPAFPGDSFSARLEAIAPGLDSETRTLAVRGTVSDPGHRLKSEMLANVALASGRMGQVIRVPDEAVQEIRGQTLVFLATPDGKGGATFMGREVVPGGRAGGVTTILSGLSAGDVVVTTGAFAVKAEYLKGSMPEMEM